MKIRLLLFGIFAVSALALSRHLDADRAQAQIPQSNDSGFELCPPADFMLVLDRSGSMRSDLPDARDAASNFVDLVKNSTPASGQYQSRVGIVSFGRSLWPPAYDMPFPNGISFSGPGANPADFHQELTSDFDLVKSKINGIAYKGGGSCLMCGLWMANQELFRNASPNTGFTRKVVVFLSDGQANRRFDGSTGTAEARQGTKDQAIEGRTHDIEYYSLNFGSQGNDVMRDVANDPDSKYHIHTPNSVDWKDSLALVHDIVCRDPTPTPDAPIICTDSDGGTNYQEQGTAQETQGASVVSDAVDTCVFSTTSGEDPVASCDGPDCYLREYSCAGGSGSDDSTGDSIRDELYQCPSGACVDGACVPEPAPYCYQQASVYLPPLPEAMAVLSLSASKSSVVVGDTFDVTVTLNTDGARTSATDLLITYDPAVVSLDSGTNGALYDQYFAHDVDNTAGTATISAITSPGGTPFNGTGTYAVLHFMALANGTAPITIVFEPDGRNDSNVVELTSLSDVLARVDNTTVSVGQTPTPTSTGPTPTPTTAQATFNMSVQEPAGGAVVQKGSTQTIRWTFDQSNQTKNPPYRTRLSYTCRDLSTQGGPQFYSEIITQDATTTLGANNAWTWNVPTTMIPGSSCRVLVFVEDTLIKNGVTTNANATSGEFSIQGDPTTPGPTQAPVNMTVTVRVKFQGIELSNIADPANNTQDIQVELVKQTLLPQNAGFTTYYSKGAQTVSVTTTGETDAGGIAIWQGQVAFTQQEPGSNYSVLIKGPRHLKRKFCANNPTEDAEAGLPYRCLGPGTLSLAAGANSLDFSQVLLQAGDLPGPNGQDGILNVHDVSLVLNMIRNGQSTDPADLAIADMDLNGVVNAKDRSYLIETLEEKYGDEE